MTVQQYCLRWNNHQPNFISVFSSLLNSQSLVDVTLAAEGKQLQAHKVVLSACSSYFQSLFATNPCKHPIVILKDVKFTDLKVMVDFMYHGEVSVSQEQLPCILKTAEMLKIKGLTEIPMENPAVKCHSQPEKTEIGAQSTDNWSFDENRPVSPSSPSSKRRRLKKNVICSSTITTENAEGTQNEILLSTANNVFESVLKSDNPTNLEDNSQKYNGIPIPSMQPSTSHQRDTEQTTHQIITHITPPQDVNVNTSQVECSPVEIPRTCTTSQSTTVTFSPGSSQSPPLQEHMGPKRGRFLMRQSRIKREPDLYPETEIEPVALSQYLTLPPPIRIERQCSEPIPSISPSPDNLLNVPEHVLIKQHSHPILPSKSTESNTRSSHCPVVRLGPALGCNFCWNTVDTHGRTLRRKTKYHCPECQTNLCIVPCFQEYHKSQGTQGSGGRDSIDPILPSSPTKIYPKSN
ncbi:protein tramtrack, alpha isoform-like isoform X1 [Diorhabda carinulata]|uniref:protein tramtrack, alpha isoform-like isoform X1 n=1 Tax=Diorhabda carinulata TaxID=1163345 RepID=UPI0025A0A227|nr:protein tramtrack, alpha isoform-like isoform X1 [Diorhabda carinulata]XP_057652323.1 protein tramtrack, alpha isoform-like isoform X1 [Diorhabda carinulata]XP_057652324.1 protein tramtrack, alpha isoform-like isoform X1 [Diorhabda carinulata]XP_057652325.1 protein tramtrack, alpha isoform-like isoform X1 [Diorhabda carinulata]XP_057652326.1 protein tramtrack, alpha isoform-like isoform X1 [Diorhabda carinulata]XP_057652327.1 protein tramtrack, alpha isoform-like isoform X1 [Diorhabda carin